MCSSVVHVPYHTLQGRLQTQHPLPQTTNDNDGEAVRYECGMCRPWPLDDLLDRPQEAVLL